MNLSHYNATFSLRMLSAVSNPCFSVTSTDSQTSHWHFLKCDALWGGNETNAVTS